MNPKPTITLALAANDLLIYPPEGNTPEDLQRQLQAAGWWGRFVVDQRRKCLRALPIDYPALSEVLQARYDLHVEFDPRPALAYPVVAKQEPRPYQLDALR